MRAILAESRAAAREELRERLAADRRVLARHFGRGVPLGRVAEAHEGLSDRHHGGRTVCRVRFASGVELAYKPRDLGAEEQFHRLLAWLRRRGLEDLPRPLAVCNRGTHGWVEWVEPEPPIDGSDVARLGLCLGGLLCVLELLAARDCHGQNVVARRSQPLLVDAETLLHRRMPGEDVRESVLATGLTPYWKRGPRGLLQAGGSGGALDPHSVPQILEGYRRSHAFLGRHREALLEGPLRELVGARVRVLLRDTASYVAVFREGLRQGARHEETWRRLLREELDGALPDVLVDDELRALRRLDVPRFTAVADETALVLDGGEQIPRFFSRPASEELATRLDEWERPPLDERLALIRASYTLAGLAAGVGAVAEADERFLRRWRKSTT